MPVPTVGPVKHSKALTLEQLVPGTQVIEVNVEDRRLVTIDRIEDESDSDARIFFVFKTTPRQQRLHGWGSTRTTSVRATDYGAIPSPCDGQWNLVNRFEQNV
ncbi:MAG TPA: hypothetical protein VFT30_10150 [Nitrospira sp.]|nr:hypothetical protein [Nitrospira sp.]